MEDELDRTRARIEARVHELQQRVRPGEIFEHAWQRVRSDGGEFLENLGRGVRENPLPVTLSGLALGWLVMATRRPPDEPRDGPSTAAQSAREALAGARQAADRGVERVRSRSREARQTYARLLDEQPLVLGIVGVAAGAALGATLPASEAEDRALGGARDELVREAAQQARAEPA